MGGGFRGGFRADSRGMAEDSAGAEAGDLGAAAEQYVDRLADQRAKQADEVEQVYSWVHCYGNF